MMAPELDVVVVGHVAIDVNMSPWGVIENALGGAPTYAGFALAEFRKATGIISKVGTDFSEKFPPIYRKLDLDTEGILVAGGHTTTFENIYDESGNRTQVCKHILPEIRPEDIPNAYKNARSFYVSPIANEVTPNLLRSLKRETNLVMFDPQGVFRRIGDGGKVEIEMRADLADFLKHVDVVKIGKEETRALWGGVREILEWLLGMGPKIAILTRGEMGCAVLSGGRFREIEALKVGVKDLTGAGDIFGVAFLARYLDTHDVLASAEFANAAAGLKIRYKGPTGFPSEGEVLNAIQ